MPVKPTLKQRFLTAVIAGELGTLDEDGALVTVKQFKAYFKKQITTQYISSFLPAATIETGQSSASHTRFVFRLSKGEYRVHPDAIEEAIELIISAYVNRTSSEPDDEDEPDIEDDSGCYVSSFSSQRLIETFNFNSSVIQSALTMRYQPSLSQNSFSINSSNFFISI